ncbi:MAG: glycosyltransferase family 2 protein [Candidatus Magasanikbacteria bacterium]|nr:glycosyltransferase family 2 protein [Candidatus Magasanikbacteria bacterium]
MELSIITVTWNSKNTIGRLIDSIPSAVFDPKTGRSLSYEHWVVDNASTDGAVEWLKEKYGTQTVDGQNMSSESFEFTGETIPRVRVWKNSKNEGFGAANNWAFHRASGDFILFLNPDMKLEPESLFKACEWMWYHREVGIMAPKLVTETGEVNLNAGPRRFPTVWNQLAIVFKIPHLFPQVLHQYLMKDFDYSKEQDVETVRGSYMLVRHDLLTKLGTAFDPRYFIWFEDVDLCKEARKHGYKVVYNPAIQAVDYVGQSFNLRTTLWKQKNFTASMVKYFKKWGPWYAAFLVTLARPVGIVLAWVGDKVAKK